MAVQGHADGAQVVLGEPQLADGGLLGLLRHVAQLEGAGMGPLRRAEPRRLQDDSEYRDRQGYGQDCSGKHATRLTAGMQSKG